VRLVACRRHASSRVFTARAFTLMELVISGALMSVVMVAAYLCLTAGTGSQRLVERRSDAAQSGRVAMAMIAADLRSAVQLSKEHEFIGMRRALEDIDADNLDFATRNFVPTRPEEGDWCETSYFVQKDAKTGEYLLLRRRDPTPDPEPLSGGNAEEIARGVKGFRLEYYDGWEWFDEWGDPEGKEQFSALPEPNASGMPEAVRITLTLATGEKVPAGVEEPTFVLQTTARLNMALFFYQSTGGSSTNSSGNSAESGGPAQNAPPSPGGPQ
jgi:type II secretory pathway component PulJ